ncbi:calcium/manganese antiporter SLC30A10 isoform X1 [Ahaetulla prasina]|uniref:calcium/manganese antiporter SLC30A10 isoform X1 n=1 Tax=Ahaetulla prasina TaxID=499056 RepID=UPI002648C791|nr:calcium/manganese antiporter SLC30A10 isoform X1 [Ahaetulla prasina]
MGRYTGKTCRLLFMLGMTASFFVTELVSGYVGNSIALVSDSFAMLSDVLALCVGIVTGRLSHQRRRRPGASYGSGRAEVVGALCNAVFLAALYFTILLEALQRLARPESLSNATLILVVGTIGLAINVVGLLVFQDWTCCCGRGSPPPPYLSPEDKSSSRTVAGSSIALEGMVEMSGSASEPRPKAGDSADTQKKPEENKKQKTEKKSEALNIRGVLLHVMGDALGSVIVVVAASIFYILPLDENTPCNWQCYIDPSLTIVMVFIILSSAFPLIKETATILLQMVPKNVNMQILANKLLEVPGVSSIHELHVWEFIKGKNIATLHVKCHSTSDYPVASYKIREVFHEEGIHSVTIQPEYLDHDCPKVLCSTPCISRSCDPQLCCNQKDALLSQMNGYSETIGSFSPSLKKVFQKKDAIEIPVEPTWAEDMVKRNSCSKDSYKEKSETMPQINSTQF